jgi:hypothetical protein
MVWLSLLPCVVMLQLASESKHVADRRLLPATTPSLVTPAPSRSPWKFWDWSTNSWAVENPPNSAPTLKPELLSARVSHHPKHSHSISGHKVPSPRQTPRPSAAPTVRVEDDDNPYADVNGDSISPTSTPTRSPTNRPTHDVEPYSWVASVVDVSQEGGPVHLCTGSMLKMGVFVAPAHCFFDFTLKAGKTKHPLKTYRVVLPRISYEGSSVDEESRSLKIRKIMRHPEVSNTVCFVSSSS